MVTFRNNNRRGRFRSNDRGFKRTGDGSKYKSDFHSNGDFQRKSLNRNNHNASKLVEKYNNLAREALANEDKILSSLASASLAKLLYFSTNFAAL